MLAAIPKPNADLLARGFDEVTMQHAEKQMRGAALGADLTGFASTIINRLDDVLMTDAERELLLDEINQMMIDALPPASARRHFKRVSVIPMVG